LLSPVRLNPDDFPDSPYARELPAGISWLRFAPELEGRFIAAHLQRVRLRVQIWFSLNVVLAALFTVERTLAAGLWSTTFWFHVLGIVPCAAMLAWLSYSRGYQRSYLPTARLLVPSLGALIAIFVAQAAADNRDEELALLAVNVFAAFFFTGLLLRAALTAASAIVAAFTITSLMVHLQVPFEIGKSVLVLSVTLAISAVIYRDMERSYRNGFIEAGLIAELVARDGLTGLMNRRAFDEHLIRVWQQGLRDHRNIALLLLDVDHFKIYNDTFGHLAGDAALRALGQLLKGFARRPLDLASRFGGEEFAMIFYDLSNANVQDIAERIRLGVQAAGAGITVSIGVGIVSPTLGRTPEGAIQLADEALYEAKNAGRNRVVLKGLEEYRNLHTGSFKSVT